MKRSRTMENMEIEYRTVPNNEKNGIREWNGSEELRIWKFGMERSQTMENMEI